MQNPTKDDNFIHRIKNVPDIVDGATILTYYDTNGKISEVDSSKCVAKKSFDPATGLTRFWAKRATFGGDAGKLFNEQSPTFIAATSERLAKDMGKAKYEYKNISEEGFKLYLQFLQTKNSRYIHQAERYSF